MRCIYGEVYITRVLGISRTCTRVFGHTTRRPIRVYNVTYYNMRLVFRSLRRPPASLLLWFEFFILFFFRSPLPETGLRDKYTNERKNYVLNDKRRVINTVWRARELWLIYTEYHLTFVPFASPWIISDGGDKSR